MKGTTKLEITKATVLVALQAYFDGQLTGKHNVTGVEERKPSYGGGVSYEVTLEEGDASPPPEEPTP